MTAQITKIASLSEGEVASGVHYPQLIDGDKYGILKIDWIVADITGTPSITPSIVAKLDIGTDNGAIAIDVDGNQLTWTEADFGSPAGVGTYSLTVKIMLTPQMVVSATNSNALSNIVNVYLLEE